MALPVIASLIFLFSFSVTVAEYCATDGDGTCTVSPSARRHGGAMIQTVQARTQTMPISEASDGLSYTTRINSIESRVNVLEQESLTGRTALKTDLDALTQTVETFRAGGDGSLEHTTGRVTDTESKIVALSDTVSVNSADLRADIASVRNDFENLGKSVGDQFKLSMLQQHADENPAAEAEAEDEATDAPAALQQQPAPAAPASPAAASTVGQPLTTRVTGLEDRATKLEQDSNSERDALTNQLQMLQETVETIRAGGVASLEHTIGRVTSSSEQLSTLDADTEGQQNTAQADIDALKLSIGTLGKKVGVGMLQTKADRQTPAAAEAAPAAPAAAAGGVGFSAATTLSLATRMSALEKRVRSLEEASATGREALTNGLTALSAKVDGMQAGGVSSLGHTVQRVGDAEKQLSALESATAQKHTDLKAAIAAVRTSLEGLTSLVGA